MNDKSKSGSALVIVLGMLAVLMMLAVAFSVFMRTERGGTTNMRHAVAARLGLNTAIAAVQAAVDASFGYPPPGASAAQVAPTNVLTAPVWKDGVLGSSAHAPYFQSKLLTKKVSGSLNSGEIRTFRVNKRDSPRVVTSSVKEHLAPAQYALANNASIEWSPIMGGILASEMVNQATNGTAYGYSRPENDGVVGRYAFIALNTTGLLDMNYACGGVTNRDADVSANPRSFSIKDAQFSNLIGGQAVFTNARRKSGEFFSYAHMLNQIGRSGIKADGYGYPGQGNWIDGADLFTTFTTSLEEAAPSGVMKIPLELPASLATGNSPEKIAYATKAHPAFQAMFTEGGNRNHTFGTAFASTRLPQLTRSELATQALVDYLDEDDIPAGGVASGGTNPLDYPCTESVPMVQGVYAWFTREKTKTGALNGQNYQEWKLDLNVLPVIANPSKAVQSPQGANKTYKARIEINIEDVANQLGELWPSGSILSPPPGWSIDANLGAGSVGDVQANSENILTFTTSEHPIADQSWGVFQSGPVMPALVVKAFEKTPGLMDYREFSELAEGGDPREIHPEVKVKITIINERGETVQQVPSPALDNPAWSRSRYWVNVKPGLYHGPGTRTGASSEFETGWAMTADPRFAYNTESMYFDSGYRFWLNNDQARTLPNSDPRRKLLDKLVAIERSSDLYTDYPQANAMLGVLFDKTASAVDIKGFWDALANNMPIYPDSVHSFGASENLFLGTDSFMSILQHGVMNRKMESAGELGSLVIGPMETISLFNTFLPDGKSVQHRALDHFTTRAPRSPISAPGQDDELFPAVHIGRVNLNAPRRIQQAKGGDVGVYGIVGEEFNTQPLAVLFNGARYSYSDNKSLGYAEAEKLVAKFLDNTWLPMPGGKNTRMATRLSDIGNGAKAGDLSSSVGWTTTPMLAEMYALGLEASLKCDADREAVLVNTVNGMTVRGQTFLAIVRADAFTPSFGSESLSEGTSLSSVRALVELWRDPDYPRWAVDGVRVDDGVNPNSYSHGWYVRSVRVLE